MPRDPKSRTFHVFPYWPGGPAPTSDEWTETEIWDEIRETTKDLRDDRRVVFVPSTHFTQDRILNVLGGDVYDRNHVDFIEAIKVGRTWTTPNEGKQTIEKVIPFDLRSLACQRTAATKANLKGRDNILAVMLEEEDPTDPPFDLTPLFKLCPDLTVYIFHLPSDEKCGVFTEGEDVVSVDVEFPGLSSLLHREMEIIVDKWLAKSGIHVWAGMYEACKTMAFIEFSDAVLSFDPTRTDNRKAFDYFEVHARYEFLLLEADMDMAQFDDYAKPWNLRRHGKAFRVNRPDSEILRGLDDPVLQRAVKNKILGIDTMMDYAQIQRAFESGEWIAFFRKLRDLINVHGCIAIIMLVHPTKTGARSTTIEPTEFLKDSITFGGKIDAGMAFSPLENGSEIFIQPVKGRAFKGDKRGFTLMHHGEEGENYFDMGRFPVSKPPETAGKREDHSPETRGRKADKDRDRKIEFLMMMDTESITVEEKMRRLNEEFSTAHPEGTIKTWVTEGRRRKVEAEKKVKTKAAKQLAIVSKKMKSEEMMMQGVVKAAVEKATETVTKEIDEKVRSVMEGVLKVDGGSHE